MNVFLVKQTLVKQTEKEEHVPKTFATLTYA